MNEAHLILTDSGIKKKPLLGKPVLPADRKKREAEP
jgi:hypothetical protein